MKWQVLTISFLISQSVFAQSQEIAATLNDLKNGQQPDPYSIIQIMKTPEAADFQLELIKVIKETPVINGSWARKFYAEVFLGGQHSEALLLEVMNKDSQLEYNIDRVVEVLSTPERGDWLKARAVLMQVVRAQETMTEPPLKMLELFRSPYLLNAEESLVELLRYLPKRYDAQVARLLFQRHSKRWNRVVRALIKRRDIDAMDLMTVLRDESRGQWPWDKSLNEALELYQVGKKEGFKRAYEPLLKNSLAKPQMSCGKLF